LTKEIVNKHFPKVFKGIHFTNAFPKDGSKTISKLEACDKERIDVLIDDNLKFALECAKEHRKVLLFDSPWNQAKELPKEIHRVYDWEEIVEKIAKFNDS
jgi:uncharacterized HAD superfamily protein